MASTFAKVTYSDTTICLIMRSKKLKILFLRIKLGNFTPDELDKVLKNTKNKKAAGPDNTPPETWNTLAFNYVLCTTQVIISKYTPSQFWDWVLPPRVQEL